MPTRAQDLIDKLPPERRERIAKLTERMEAEEATLRQLREAQRKSQEELAVKLGVGQPSVAKLEQRTDVYVKTLRKYVEALGGELEITARFPGRDPVRIAQFADE